MDGRESTDCHTAGQGWVEAMARVEAIALIDMDLKSDFRNSRTSGMAGLWQLTNRTPARCIRPILVRAGSYTRCGGLFGPIS